MNDKPEFYVAHGNERVYGIYVIFHETAYYYRVRKYRLEVHRLDYDGYNGNPKNIRDNMTSITEIAGLFESNLTLFADPLVWETKGTGGPKVLNLKRAPRPEPKEEEDEDGN